MDLSQRLDEMELAIHKPSFRKGTGRANEVNYWVFDYPPEKELEVRERVEYLKNKNDRGDDDFELALDYNIIGVWLVCHRKYRDWSTEKSYDLAWILEFMQAYHMTIPRYIKRTKFYRKKMKLLLSSLVRDKDQSQEKGQ